MDGARGRPPTWLAIAGVAVVYVAVAQLSLRLALHGATASPVWPPAGLAIAAVLILGRRVWPGILIGEFVANVWHGAAWPAAAAMGLGNSAEALVAAWLIGRWHPGRFETEPVGLARFGVAAAIAGMISSTTGVTSLVVAGAFPITAAPMVWLTWWLGNVAGAVVLVPLLLHLVHTRTPWQRPTESVLMTTGLAAILLAGLFVFEDQAAVGVLLLALPLLLLAALRHEPRIVGFLVAVFVFVAVLATANQHGPLYTGDTNSDLLVLGFLTSNLSLTFLGLATLQQRQRRTHAALAHDVETRTLELSDVEGRFRAFMDHLPGQAWIKDAEGRYVYANPALAASVGRDAEALRGTTDPEVFPPEMAAEFQAHDTNVQRASAAVFHEETRLVAGEPRDTLVTRFRLDNTEGGAPLVGGIAVDITDRKAAQAARVAAATQVQEIARLHEIDELKGQFIKFAAHELRTPLTPIRTQLHLIKRQSEQMPEASRRSIDVLDRNFQRLAHLIEDVLEGSRAQTGTLQITHEPVDVSDVAQEAINRFQPQANAAGLTIKTDLVDAPVRADGKRLDQVISHLVENAIRFTPKGGTVTIDVRPYEGGAMVTVEDTGVGIPPDKIDQLFRPFTHLHHDPGAGGTGSGLGLFVARTVIALHGGHIACHSDGPGKGTRFSFTVPGGPEVAAPFDLHGPDAEAPPVTTA